MERLQEEMQPPKGAIFYTGKFGATRQYAQWIAEATGLPAFDLVKSQADPADYSFLVLGSAVYIHRMAIRRWLYAHWPALKGKPVFLFSVSGTAPDHPGIEDILDNSLSTQMRQAVTYLPLQGRLILEEAPWWLRLFLRVGVRVEKDEAARERMRKGFDFMNKDNINPVLKWVERQQAKAAV